MIRLKDILKESNNKEIKSLIDKLEAFALQGDLTNPQIEDIANKLKSARRKMFSSKITPDQRKASAAKAVKTKAKINKDFEKQWKKDKEVEIQALKIMNNRFRKNLLPLFVDSCRTNPSENYYDEWGLNRSTGCRDFELKKEFYYTPVDPRVASKHWHGIDLKDPETVGPDAYDYLKLKK